MVREIQALYLCSTRTDRLKGKAADGADGSESKGQSRGGRPPTGLCPPTGSVGQPPCALLPPLNPGNEAGFAELIEEKQ